MTRILRRMSVGVMIDDDPIDLVSRASKVKSAPSGALAQLTLLHACSDTPPAAPRFRKRVLARRWSNTPKETIEVALVCQNYFGFRAAQSFAPQLRQRQKTPNTKNFNEQENGKPQNPKFNSGFRSARAWKVGRWNLFGT